MGVVVFDSDVLIGFLNRDDAHHDAAVGKVRDSLEPGIRRLLNAVNHAEILIGPVRAGVQGRVRQMLAQLTIETVDVDLALAERAAAVRAQTHLKLPDAFALATVLHAEQRGLEGVELLSFDNAVLRAHAELRRG